MKIYQTTDNSVAPPHVVEGVSGVWHYHLAETSTNATALCGARTMSTSIKLSDWGVPFGEHFPKRPTWCAVCAQIAGLSVAHTGAKP
jgi:hypothetical protein